MSNPFRLALVGAGMITSQSHLPAALALPEATVAAIIDPVVERAAELARAYGIQPRIAANVRDVIHEVDGAVIATPNDTHRAIALACLESGVATLIEKPLAHTCEDGLEIVRAGKESGQVVAVGYVTRFRDNTTLLKKILVERQFGTIKRFVHQFGTAGGWAPLSAYNLHRKAAGGGVLVVTGSHFLDRMLHFFGYPDRVALEDDSEGGPEANCTATFSYAASGTPFDGVARYSKTVKLPGGMVIETDAGYIVVADSDEADIVFRPHSSPTIEQVIRARGTQTARDVFQLQLEDFIDACRRNHAPQVDGEQGLLSLRLIEQLYASRRKPSPEHRERMSEQVPL